MKLSDLHTHTTYCDGKNSCEEMVAAAYRREFESIGLSSHSYTPFDGGFGMTPAIEKEYKTKVCGLKEKYRDKINVYLGIEQDVWSEPAAGYDYIIGSAHYIKCGDGSITVDNTPGISDAGVREFFGGDWMKYVGAYYELAAQIPKMTGADFIGHFDLVTKFNEGNRFFDEDSHKYQSIAYEALKYTAEQCRIFEMNSGGVRRGKRSRVYPDKFLLKSMSELGCEIILSSDGHDTDSIGFMFSDMAELAKECGFRSAKYLTADGFKDYKL